MVMTVIICNSFDQSRDAFSLFMDFLEKFDCFLIREVYEYSYSVETVENIRYIFADYRLENMFRNHGVSDFIDVEQFFEGIPYYYEMEEI